MHRRSFVQAGLAAGAAAVANTIFTSPSKAEVASPDVRTFEVTTAVDLAEADEAAQLWLPVFQSAGSYQKLLDTTWDGNAKAQLERDSAYGAPILHARWDEAGTARRLKLVQHVATWERSKRESPIALSASERQFWTQSRPALPTDGIVRETARRIVGTISEPKAQLRAIYDWVVANTWRDGAVAGCGAGDIVAMLRDQRFGGKCADINSLTVGLCRAVGLPARDVYGIRLADSRLFKSLGRSDDVTGAQHCRAEVYLGEEGWFAVDPADVRKAVLEEKLPVDSPPIVALADHLFGNRENNWAGYNSATGITLADAPHEPNFHFLMYPCAMTTTSVANCLDAAKFAYRITSAEVVT